MKKYRTIAVSGGFDPIHYGHITMIRDAHKLADNVYVIVNSDAWLMRKKGYVTMPFKERKQVIENLKYDCIVVEAKDDDDTVCVTLSAIMPSAFGNGGDRKKETTPEDYLCRELGIDAIYGLGDEKTTSSRQMSHIYTIRPWGFHQTHIQGDNYRLKTLHLNPNSNISLQRHEHRSELWMVVSGSGYATINNAMCELSVGTMLTVPLNATHQIFSGDNGLVIAEAWIGNSGENDIIRY